MSKKGKIITASVIAGIMICLIICVFVVMSVRSTKINFLYQTNLSEAQVVSQLDNAKVVPYGTSVFCVNKQELITKAEQAYPKLKIYSVEFVFPNVVKINCSERVDLLCVTDKTGNSFVVDGEFKVLSMASDSQKSNLTSVVFDSDVFNSDLSVAGKVDFRYLDNCSKLFDYITMQFGEAISLFNQYFDKIEVKTGYDSNRNKIEKLVFHLKQNNKKVEFENVTFDMKKRVDKLIKVVQGEELIVEDYIILS